MNSLAIQPRWQAVVERWLAFLVTQRRLKPAAEGYQVCAGEEREDEHPHFSGHDLTLSQILSGARNELSLLNDAQWSPESLAFNHPASAPYIQELATICQQLAQRLQRPVRLLEVGTRTGRAAESLLAQLNAGQIEYVGLEQSQEMLLSARQRLAPGLAPVCPSGMQTRWRRTLTRRTLSGLITPCIVCCRKIPGSLRHYNSLPFPARCST